MRGQFGQSTVHVKREELLTRIKENRAKHRDEFERAWDGYTKAVREWLEKSLDALKAGKKIDVAFRGPIPQDHTEDYDRVIDMLQMEIRDELEIDETQFAQYVRDDWGWKGQFVTTNSTYTGA